MLRLVAIILTAIAITVVQLRAAPTELAVEMIKQHEGYSSVLYKDTQGIASIGYGTNITYIDKDEARFLLHYRLNKIDMHLSLTYDWYNNLPYVPKSIVLDMAYNMGHRSFSKFRKMHYQLERENWVKAAIEMKSSVWFRQTKLRSSYLYNMMLNYKELQ